MNKYRLTPIFYRSLLIIACILVTITISSYLIHIDPYTEKMKELIVKRIDSKNNLDFTTAESLLESESEFHSIDIINWTEHSYKPEVRFKIAYSEDQIFLKYYVIEESIRATVSKINGDVYKDSCVEFFISTGKSDGYYNFEFNCIGTPLVSYGKSRHDRVLIDHKKLKLIKSRSSLGNKPFEEQIGKYRWELMISIPKECFVFDKDIEFSQIEGRANFFKCGDDTFKPHFVTWNPIKTETPDYHQPVSFGKIKFE